MKRPAGLARSLWIVAAGALAAFVVPGDPARARVNPLTVIERQIQKPNMLILLDTSGSMMDIPGEQDIDYNEAGIDCDNGDKYCRTVGTKGRCFYSAAGRMGAGVKEDTTSCSADSQCTATAYCKNNFPEACTKDADCDSGATCKGICSNNDSKSCSKDGDCSGGGTCKGVCSNKSGVKCTSNSDCKAGEPCTLYNGDFCSTSDANQAAIKMCRLAMNRCRTDADCTKLSGDTCGPGSSRLVIAKRVLNSIVQRYYSTVNFGFMSFTQKNHFPYYKIDSSNVSYETRTEFLGRTQLQAASPSCFSESTGPTDTCTINDTKYTLLSKANSRYRLNRGTTFASVDASWSSKTGCLVECELKGEGTALYEGSYYTHQVPVGTPTSTKKTFSDYAGKLRTDSGTTYLYWDAPTTVRNENGVYGDGYSDVISGGSGDTCSKDLGGSWNQSFVPFMDTSKELSTANAQKMALGVAKVSQKASFGGLSATGGTPSGCALLNEGEGAAPQFSAYHYMEQVQKQNASAGVTCRPDYILFVTDGHPNGPGEQAGSVDCSHSDCSKNPLGPDCKCKSIINAKAIHDKLGIKVYVVGFSSSVDKGYAATSLNNIAQAGGTGKAFFATQEQALYQKMTEVLYDAVKGSYATAPLTVGASYKTGKGFAASSIVLDSRADFPSWKGHLIAYDVEKENPLLWDASTFLPSKDDWEKETKPSDPNFWKKRNVWTSDGTSMIKLKVAADGTIENAATLASLGLGATEAEAALVARWMLGDPAMKNPAVFGAIVNSTPIEIGPPGGGTVNEPHLIYVGSSDGMIHAFHSKTQVVGTTTYQGGTEAFAYIPQDMLRVIRSLFVQGGQLADPSDHVFGMANSPKVKRICTANCDKPGEEVLRTMLVMNQGYGGDELLVLDVTEPFDGVGVKTSSAPVTLRWHSQYTVSNTDKSEYDAALGQTISVPGFYYAKSATKDDYRLIFASGYTNETSSTKGLALINASVKDGVVKEVVPTTGVGQSCAKAKVDPTEPTVLADVAVARRYNEDTEPRIAAAYVGDTWGNLYRYVPTTDDKGNILTKKSGTLSLVDAFTCSHPLHFSPTVVQPDHDSKVHQREIYLVQVTNSAMDGRTLDVSADFPASQMIIRKDQAGSISEVDASSLPGSKNKIVLSVDNQNQICGEFDAAAKTCKAAMPLRARPMSSPMAVLKEGYGGFVLLSLWYAPDQNGCSKGSTYLTVHDVTLDSTEFVKQSVGENVGNEPVVGAVFAAGKLVVVLETGPKVITSEGLGPIGGGTLSPGGGSTLVDRFRQVGWSELP